MTRLMINLKVDGAARNDADLSTDFRNPIELHENLGNGSQQNRLRQGDVEVPQHGNSNVYVALWYAKPRLSYEKRVHLAYRM